MINSRLRRGVESLSKGPRFTHEQNALSSHVNASRDRQARKTAATPSEVPRHASPRAASRPMQDRRHHGRDCQPRPISADVQGREGRGLGAPRINSRRYTRLIVLQGTRCARSVLRPGGSAARRRPTPRWAAPLRCAPAPRPPYGSRSIDKKPATHIPARARGDR